MRFSASKAALLTKCRYPFREDAPIPATDNHVLTPSEDARCGSALHRCAEWKIKGTTGTLAEAAAEFDVTEALPRLARTWIHMERWIEDHAAEPLTAEVKFALDLRRETARVLTAKGDRDYSDATADEIPMTIDVVNVSLNERRLPSFRDWKTGHNADGYWPQIGVNALAVAWWIKRNHPLLWNEYQAVEGGIIHATGAGIDESRVRLFDRYDLVAIGQDLLGDLASVPTATPTPGDHCLDLYCPAFRGCPATLARVEAFQLVASERLARRDEFALSPTIQSAEHAAWAIECLRTYEAYARQVKAAIAAFVGEEEHALCTGGTLKQTYREVPRTSLVDLIALARSMGATDEQVAACTHMSRESAGIRVVGKPKRAA